MSKGTKVLIAKNIHKQYKIGKNYLKVINGIDIEFKKGECVVITGPSGAGKSTLLHILALLDAPDKGEVFIGGNNAFAMNETKRAFLRNTKIGFVFQFYHLLSEFNALENVLMPALIKLKNSKQQYNKRLLKDKAFRLLKEVGLGTRANHKPSQLSGGEQQRVAIIRALMNEPEILFCDEPTGNLDSKSGEAVCKLLSNVNKTYNQTIVIATHEIRISKLADRIIHIEDGKI